LPARLADGVAALPGTPSVSGRRRTTSGDSALASRQEGQSSRVRPPPPAPGAGDRRGGVRPRGARGS